MTYRPGLLLSLLLSLSLSTAPSFAQQQVIDDFDTLAGWKAFPSDGATLRIGQGPGRHGKSMRLDFAFHGAGYAAARKNVSLTLPVNYAFDFWIRGDAPVNALEFKLVDSTGENVWWVNRPGYVFPKDWRDVHYKKRHIQFAWGPLGGGDISRVAAIEITITAGTGGSGTVYIDDLTITPLAPDAPYAQTPVTTPAAAAVVLDGDTTTAWHGGSTFVMDFLQNREFSGVVLDWAPGMYATDYNIDASADGRDWQPLDSVRSGDGGRDYLDLPESDWRYLRLRVLRAGGSGVALRELHVQPLQWGATRNAFFQAVANDAQRGDYPKYFTGVQTYWTVVGADADEKEALLNEQGALEVEKKGFSLEPFVRIGGRLITWADVQVTPTLLDGYLPIPGTRWQADAFSLAVTTFTDGVAGASTLYARYALSNPADTAIDATLYLAMRPFQVNPPAQFLNGAGGVAEVNAISGSTRRVRVTTGGTQRDVVIALTEPTAFGATTFDAGDIVTFLRRGALPSAAAVSDAHAAASAAFSYRVHLKPRVVEVVYVAVPLHAGSVVPPAGLSPQRAEAVGDARLSKSRAYWMRTLARTSIHLPRAQQALEQSLQSNLAYILINRDGAGLQPGSRSYERSWIRDGSLESTALLRLGHAEAARAFIQWYAGFQFPNGKVPCCVDRRGADPVPENDSHGEFIYAVAEYYRFTHDAAFASSMWPHVVKAVAYLDSLRGTHMTAEYQADSLRAYYGLVPASISHEGYSAKPMHSYWDDSFVYTGLRDAAYLADELHKPERTRYAGKRDEFRRDLINSYQLAMAAKHIDFLPGSVELGDFDATSTTVALSPGGLQDSLPEPALARTFERYYDESRARATGTPWRAFTPYEWRTVGSMIRLGWPARAMEMVDFFMRYQRPAAWRQWGEVVYEDSTQVGFIGDMPHTWVGSDFIRSTLDLFAYDRDEDSTLVIGAGVPAAFVTADSGVRIEHLRTHHGSLNLAMSGDARAVHIQIGGDAAPPGGFIVHAPYDMTIARATVNGKPVAVEKGIVRVATHRAPITIEMFAP